MPNPRLQHALDHIVKRGPLRKIMHIYVMECQGFYKVGITENVRHRVSTVQTASPFPVTLVASWRSADAKREEKRIHSLLHRYHERGEWFKLPPALVAELLKLAVDS